MKYRVLLVPAISAGLFAFWLLLWQSRPFQGASAQAVLPPRIVKPPITIQPVFPAGYEALLQKIQAAIQQGPHFSQDESLPVYRVKPVEPQQLREQAAALANRTLARIGGGQPFSATAFTLDGNRLVARNDKGVLVRTYLPSGFLSVVNQEQLFRGRCLPLSDSQAADIARKFVAGNKIVALLANESLTLADVWRVRSQGMLASKQTSERVLNNIIVILGRQLGDKAVIGPGGRVVTFLGGSGEVLGFERNWREIDPAAVDKVRAKGPVAAARAVVAELARVFGPRPPSAQAFHIRRAECGYFAASKRKAQKFLQPAYAVHIEVEGEKMPHIAQVIVVSGGDRLLEPLAPVAAELKGQPRAVRVPLTTRDDD